MPEGDTVAYAAKRLHEALAGKPLTAWDLRWGSAATSDLTGRRTLEVVAAGKHLLHRVEGGATLHSHLRMEGRWDVQAPAASTGALRRHTIRAVVGAADRWAVGSKLGMLDLVPTDQEHRLVGHLGPDLLAEDFDLELVLGRLAEDPRPLGEALLDQRVLAGLGTYWISEELFVARLDPARPADRSDPEALRAALTRARRLMRRSAVTGQQTSTGATGRDGMRAHVHGRPGRPCVRCRRPLEVLTVGPLGKERRLPWCPSCQG